MSGGGGGDGKTPTLNVVSMVDVIFNVIVFFIITAKAANDEMPKLVVPKVDTPMASTAPVNPPPRMIISVLSAGYNDKLFDEQMKQLQTVGAIGAIGVSSGRAYEVRVGDEHMLVPQQLPKLTQMVKDIKTRRTKDLSEKDKKSFEVLLRADLALPYSEVRPVMNAISAAGIQNVNLMAYKQ